MAINRIAIITATINRMASITTEDHSYLCSQPQRLEDEGSWLLDAGHRRRVQACSTGAGGEFQGAAEAIGGSGLGLELV